MIDKVRTNAFICIDKILERDKEFFLTRDEEYDFSWLYKQNSPYKWLYKSEEANSGKPHPYRILDSHIGYLQHYQEYIGTLCEEELSDSDKISILRGVSAQMSLYIQKREEIKKMYPNY